MTALLKSIQALQQHNIFVILHACGSEYQQELMRSLTSGHTVVDLALPGIRMQVEQNPQLFIRGLKLPVYLANLQYAPKLLRQLLHSGLPLGQVMGGCSQSYYLEEAAKEDAERIALLELPLTACEQPPFVPDAARWEKFASIAVRHDVIAAAVKGSWGSREAAAAYIRRVLQQDIMELTTVSDEIKFYRFVCVVASMTGTVVNYASLANSVGVTAPTAKQWLCFLAGAGMVYFLPPVEKVGSKRLVKASKLYFADTGVAAGLLQLNDMEAALQSVYLKNLYENYVVNAVRTSYLARGEQARLLFYRDSNNKEISLVLQRSGVIYSVAVTLDAVNVRRLTSTFAVLEAYAAEQKAVLGMGCVVVPDGETRQLNERLWQVNAGII